MAFALTKFRAYKVEVPTAIAKYGLQAIEMTVTRGASDVLMDLDTTTGTFWTAAKANGTYGAMATQAAVLFNDLLGKIEQIPTLSLVGDGAKLVNTGAPYESGSSTVKWGGGVAGTALNADSADQTFRYSIVNGECVLSVPAFDAAAKASSPGNVIKLKSTTLLAAAARPSIDQTFPIVAVNNNKNCAGYAVVKTTGQVEVYTLRPVAVDGTLNLIWAGGSAGTALNADSVAQTVKYRVHNGMVQLDVPAYAAAAKGAAPGNVIILKSTTLLPAELRPVEDKIFVQSSVNNAAAVIGTVIIKTTGQIELYTGIPSAAAYTVTANAGTGGFNVSYAVAESEEFYAGGDAGQAGFTVAYPVAQAAADSAQVSIQGTFPEVKPRITLAANASPATLKLFMLCALTERSNPIEFT